MTYNVKAAVDADQQGAIEIAGPAVGDAYLIVTETSSIGWLINTIQIWNGAGWDVITPNDGEITAVIGSSPGFGDWNNDWNNDFNN